jgi:hypothetical protein
MERSQLAFYLCGTDIASMVILLVGLFLIKRHQALAEHRYNSNTSNAKVLDFTIHFKEMGIKSDQLYSEFNDLIHHLNTVLQIETGEKTKTFIYDFNYSEISQNLLDLYDQKYSCNVKINSVLKQMIGDKSDIFDKSEQSYSELLKLKLDVYQASLKEINERIEMEKNIAMVDDVFVTFINRSYANAISKAYRQNWITRLCIYCCKRSKITHL